MGPDPILGYSHLSAGETTIMANKMPKQSRGILAFIGRLIVRGRDGLGRTFARREVFVRQGAGTTRIVLDGRTQVQLAVVGIGLLTWFAYSTSGVMMGKTSIHAMQDRLAETHNAYENRLADMQEDYEALNLKLILAKKEFSRMTKELQIRHDHLATLIGMQDRLGAELNKRRKINRSLNKKQLKKNGSQSFLTPIRNSDSTFLTSRPVGPTQTPFPAIKAKKSAKYFNGLQKTDSRAINAIGKKLAAIEQRQRAILDHFDEKITATSKIYEHAFHITEAIEPDLFAERMFAAQSKIKNNTNQESAGQESAGQESAGQESAGGPFLPIAKPDQIKNKNASKNLQASDSIFMPISQDIKARGETHSFLRARRQINRVHQQLKKLTVLESAVRQLPLAKPLPTYYVTSAYGPRVDPFTREWAFHTGVDIAGRSNSRVHATLPGIVSFVGNARGYGKMIEIDHGHGIKTRYGHLGKTHLKFGQRIKFKQYIGIMGNTGRSTGEHLHYEILVDDKPYDPWKFIEAGKYVFEISE